MVIDHIGLVVPSLEQGIRQWREEFGYTQMTEPVENSRQKVKVIFMQKANSVTIKLVEPSDDASPVHRLALKGGGLHHICFRCSDVDTELKRLEGGGARTLTASQPGEAFDGASIAFVFCENGLNIELIDTDKKAQLIAERG